MRLVEGKRWRILCIGIFTNSGRTKLVHALAFHGRHDQSPVQPPSRDYTGVSRRQAVRLVGLTAAPLVVATLTPPPANAAGPVSPRETEGLPARLARALRPRPVKSLRSRLNLDFAVLLMRSSYNALDELDCVAMDQFQRDFFLIRQAEYEPYVELLGPGAVQQGDLSDPYYFDFISLAQYRTINREVTNDPPLVFSEMRAVSQPGDDSTDNDPQQFIEVVVRRDPSLQNDMLVAEHGRRVGAAIVDRFEETYDGTPIALPPPDAVQALSDPDGLLALLSRLVKLFIINGFAWDGRVDLLGTSAGGSTARTTNLLLTLVSPANLWSGKALQSELCPLKNDFLLKATRELLQRRGYQVTKSSVRYEGINELTSITVVFPSV